MLKIIWAVTSALVSIGVLLGAFATARTAWETAVIAGVALVYLRIYWLHIVWGEQTVTTAAGSWDRFVELRALLGRSSSEEESSAQEQLKEIRAKLHGAPYYIDLVALFFLYTISLGKLVLAAAS